MYPFIVTSIKKQDAGDASEAFGILLLYLGFTIIDVLHYNSELPM